MIHHCSATLLLVVVVVELAVMINLFRLLPHVCERHPAAR